MVTEVRQFSLLGRNFYGHDWLWRHRACNHKLESVRYFNCSDRVRRVRLLSQRHRGDFQKDGIKKLREQQANQYAHLLSEKKKFVS